MRKLFLLFSITLFLILLVFSESFPRESENMSWKQILEKLKYSEEPNRFVSSAVSKLNHSESQGELRNLSWVLIMDALENSGDRKLFEQIAKEKLRLIKHGRLIEIAGNEEDDQIRLNYLNRLQYIANEEQVEISGLKEMISGIEVWLNHKRTEYFQRELRENIDYDFKVGENSPLYPIACIYRARMLVWMTLEMRWIYAYPEVRVKYLSKARKLFEFTRTVFPENKIIRMYLGESILPEKVYQRVAGAPEWAVYQREALERLTDSIEWWNDHRMRENGEYGGGWGDDCEMWRNWVAVLIGFEDHKINTIQSYFSNSLLNQPHLKGGYHNRMTDVEHSAEDVADALAPMMHLDPDNPEWKERAMRLAELMENFWTGRNQRGFIQFKSTYFTVNNIDTSRARACDTVFHPRAVHPALILWLRTRDKSLGKLFTDWMDTWVDAAARSEHGKPAGILPTAIHWPEGYIGGVGENWWEPKNYSTDLYDFPSAMFMMTKTLLLTYHITGKEKYLEPLRSMAKYRIEYLKNSIKNPAKGSAMWCAAGMGFLVETIAKYRFLTGNTEFDELLKVEKHPYMEYRMHGDIIALTKGLKKTVDALSVNFPALTSEVRFTDRLVRFPSLYTEGFMYKDGIESPMKYLETSLRNLDVSLLYSSVTGDPGDVKYFPLNAVRWLTPAREIAALVVETGKDKFKAELFHFGSLRREMGAEFYLLSEGNYLYTIVDKADERLIDEGLFEVKGARTKISFGLPPKRLYILNVRKNKN